MDFYAEKKIGRKIMSSSTIENVCLISCNWKVKFGLLFECSVLAFLLTYEMHLEVHSVLQSQNSTTYCVKEVIYLTMRNLLDGTQ